MVSPHAAPLEDDALDEADVDDEAELDADDADELDAAAPASGAPPPIPASSTATRCACSAIGPSAAEHPSHPAAKIASALMGPRCAPSRPVAIGRARNRRRAIPYAG